MKVGFFHLLIWLCSSIVETFVNECLDELEIVDVKLRRSYSSWETVHGRWLDMSNNMNMDSSVVEESLFDTFLIFFVADQEKYVKLFKSLAENVVRVVDGIDDPLHIIEDPKGAYHVLHMFCIPDINEERLLRSEKNMILAVLDGISYYHLMSEYMKRLGSILSTNVTVRDAAQSLNRTVMYLKNLDGVLNWQGSEERFGTYSLNTLALMEKHKEIFTYIISADSSIPTGVITVLLHLSQSEEGTWSMGIIRMISFVQEAHIFSLVEIYRSDTSGLDRFLEGTRLARLMLRMSLFVDFYKLQLELFELDPESLNLNSFGTRMMPLIRSSYLCNQDGFCLKNLHSPLIPVNYAPVNNPHTMDFDILFADDYQDVSKEDIPLTIADASKEQDIPLTLAGANIDIDEEDLFMRNLFEGFLVRKPSESPESSASSIHAFMNGLKNKSSLGKPGEIDEKSLQKAMDELMVSLDNDKSNGSIVSVAEKVKVLMSRDNSNDTQAAYRYILKEVNRAVESTRADIQYMFDNVVHKLSDIPPGELDDQAEDKANISSEIMDRHDIARLANEYWVNMTVTTTGNKTESDLFWDQLKCNVNKITNEADEVCS